MKRAVCSTYKFERESVMAAAAGKHELVLLKAQLSEETAPLARDAKAVSIFVNDDAGRPVLQTLAGLGVRYLVLRSAGFNNVDLKAASELGIKVARVPEYSPYAVAEHTVTLMLTLNRKMIKAHNRIRDLNFSLDGLIGFDMHGKTVGIVGMGKIGKVLAGILKGFGCRVLAYDPYPDEAWAAGAAVAYAPLDTLFRESDILSLHAPLTPDTRYMVKRERIAQMKKGVMLINTGRGALVNTRDVIEGL